MFHNNSMKIAENLNKPNFLKSASKLPTLQISAYFAFIFHFGKKWKYLIF